MTQIGSQHARNISVTTAHVVATRMERLWRRAACSFCKVVEVPPGGSGATLAFGFRWRFTTTQTVVPYNASSTTDGTNMAVKLM